MAKAKSKPVGKPPLPEDERKKTIGVGLDANDLQKLDTEVERQIVDTGIHIERSRMARKGIMFYLTFMELVRSKKIEPEVMQQVEMAQRGKEAAL